MSGRFVSIFAGRATKELGTKIAEAYGTQLGKSQVVVFSDGEFQPSFEESIRGHHVFIVQSTMPSTDNLMELLLMIRRRQACLGTQGHRCDPLFRLGPSRP
jgi:Phosphoribosylpyrophosphate synthetase